MLDTIEEGKKYFRNSAPLNNQDEDTHEEQPKSAHRSSKKEILASKQKREIQSQLRSSKKLSKNRSIISTIREGNNFIRNSSSGSPRKSRTPSHARSSGKKSVGKRSSAQSRKSTNKKMDVLSQNRSKKKHSRSESGERNSRGKGSKSSGKKSQKKIGSISPGKRSRAKVLKSRSPSKSERKSSRGKKMDNESQGKKSAGRSSARKTPGRFNGGREVSPLNSKPKSILRSGKRIHKNASVSKAMKSSSSKSRDK